MDIKYSQGAQHIIIYAREEAMRTGSLSVTADHLMLAMLRYRDNEVCAVLKDIGVDLDHLKKLIDRHNMEAEPIPFEAFNAIRLSKKAIHILKIAGYESLKSESNTVLPAHILLALFRMDFCTGIDFLQSQGIDYDVIYKSLYDRGIITANGTTQTEDDTKKTFGALTDKLIAMMNPESQNITFLS
ncbi:MAG TPA: hypothetical protein DDX33_03070 [Rikenellaceae bacterium]|nr:hypothetical protein [Rikenellaceae bacterium]